MKTRSLLTVWLIVSAFSALPQDGAPPPSRVEPKSGIKAETTDPGESQLEASSELVTRANKGDAAAQYSFGLTYITGDEAHRNFAEGCKWLKLAAEQGHARAQYSLGVRAIKGEGMSKDYAQAAKWFRKAAYQGLSAAQYSLAIRYVEGKGVPQDYVEAYKWFTIAEAGGKPAAASPRENLEKKNLLTAEQIREAKTRAAEFAARPVLQ